MRRTTVRLGWLAATLAGCGSGASDAPGDPRGPDAADAGGDAVADDAHGGDDAASDVEVEASPGGDADADDGATPGPLWDLAAIADPSTAACTFDAHRTAWKSGALLDVWNVSFRSWESIDGKLEPITIRGYAARPVGATSPLPGVVRAHGLGGYAAEDHATGTAALLGMFVLAYTGPGGGTVPENTSEGRPASYDGGYRMFDTLRDVRGSWFWAHTVAGLRAATCLAAHAEVDPARLGMTGFSAGGVASLMAAGADPRIVAAVPQSGTGAWSVSTASPDAWQHALLTQAGLTTASPEWTKLQAALIDPAAMVGATRGSVMMVDGTTDEFFPLTAFRATFDALPGTEKRASLVGNFDHGCYSATGLESAATIEQRASLHADGAQRALFHHAFGTDARYAYLPAAPLVQLSAVGAATYVAAVVDGGGPALDVDEVRFWWSGDDAFAFGSVTLDAQGGGLYAKLVPATLGADAVTYVDAQYTTGELLAPERFSVSSPPTIPAGLVPHIRKIASCL